MFFKEPTAFERLIPYRNQTSLNPNNFTLANIIGTHANYMGRLNTAIKFLKRKRLTAEQIEFYNTNGYEALVNQIYPNLLDTENNPETYIQIENYNLRANDVFSVKFGLYNRSSNNNSAACYLAKLLIQSTDENSPALAYKLISRTMQSTDEMPDNLKRFVHSIVTQEKAELSRSSNKYISVINMPVISDSERVSYTMLHSAISQTVFTDFEDVTSPNILALLQPLLPDSEVVESFKTVRLLKHKEHNMLIYLNGAYCRTTAIRLQLIAPILFPKLAARLNDEDKKVFEALLKEPVLHAELYTAGLPNNGTGLQYLLRQFDDASNPDVALSNLVEASKTAAIKKYDTEINALERIMADFHEEILKSYKTMLDIQQQKVIYMNTESAIDLFIQQLIKSKAVTNFRPRNNSLDAIDILVTTPVVNYEMNVAEVLYTNYLKRSGITKENMGYQSGYLDLDNQHAFRAFMHTMLVKQKGYFIFTSHFLVNFNPSTSNRHIQCFVDNADATLVTHMPKEIIERLGMHNPHLKHFHCMGDNETRIETAVRKKDYLAILPLLINTSSNLNLGDMIVLRKFTEKLTDLETAKIILDQETDELITPTEFAQKYFKFTEQGEFIL